jgi:serine/threonine protein phosphatase PrpC
MATDEEATPGVKLEAWLVTDIGRVREHNEDSAFMEPQRGFFVVADGMGGHAAGEVASAMAVETVRKSLESAGAEIEAFTRAPDDAGRRGILQLLQKAVRSAHQAVFERGEHEPDQTRRPGTTLDVVLVAGPEAFVAHVGDSRTYLIRDGKAKRITTDHTVAEVLLIEGKLTIEEAQVSPLRTILVNALGVSADVGVEMAPVTLKHDDLLLLEHGDVLLLCSDGLHDYFTDDELAQQLSADAPGKALAELVEEAKSRGGHDNITGIVVQIFVDDAVPQHAEGEETHPTEPPTSPVTPHASSSDLLDQARETQPMRALAVADTIPPPSKDTATVNGEAGANTPEDEAPDKDA